MDSADRGGILVPVRRQWAVMVDGITSHLEVTEGVHRPYTDHPFSEFYRVNPGVQNNDVPTQRLIAVLPSVVRLWGGTDSPFMPVAVLDLSARVSSSGTNRSCTGRPRRKQCPCSL